MWMMLSEQCKDSIKLHVKSKIIMLYVPILAAVDGYGSFISDA